MSIGKALVSLQSSVHLVRDTSRISIGFVIGNTHTLKGLTLLLNNHLGFKSLDLALFLFVLVVRRLRRLEVPPDAGFAETLRYTPFLVVIFIDLLDFALDILAAPIAWVILDRLGLKALRGVSAVEALIPFTQFIPTMTLCWLGVRFTNWEPPAKPLPSA